MWLRFQRRVLASRPPADLSGIPECQVRPSGERLHTGQGCAVLLSRASWGPQSPPRARELGGLVRRRGSAGSPRRCASGDQRRQSCRPSSQPCPHATPRTSGGWAEGALCPGNTGPGPKAGPLSNPRHASSCLPAPPTHHWHTGNPPASPSHRHGAAPGSPVRPRDHPSPHPQPRLPREQTLGLPSPGARDGG